MIDNSTPSFFLFLPTLSCLIDQAITSRDCSKALHLSFPSPSTNYWELNPTTSWGLTTYESVTDSSLTSSPSSPQHSLTWLSDHIEQTMTKNRTSFSTLNINYQEPLTRQSVGQRLSLSHINNSALYPSIKSW